MANHQQHIEDLRRFLEQRAAQWEADSHVDEEEIAEAKAELADHRAALERSRLARDVAKASSNLAAKSSSLRPQDSPLGAPSPAQDFKAHLEKKAAELRAARSVTPEMIAAMAEKVEGHAAAVREDQAKYAQKAANGSNTQPATSLPYRPRPDQAHTASTSAAYQAAATAESKEEQKENEGKNSKQSEKK